MKHLAVFFVLAVMVHIVWTLVPLPYRDAFKRAVSPHFRFALVVLVLLLLGLVAAFYNSSTPVL